MMEKNRYRGIIVENVISDTMEFIKGVFENDYSGHDYFHSIRVYNAARIIAEKENADVYIVSLAALLHDVDDIKLSPDTYEKKEKTIDFLKSKCVEDDIIHRIVNIIDEVSFSGKDSVTPATIEGKCVQDADRLDALGAIGIARTFAYGGSHNRRIYDPDNLPVMEMDKETYHNHVSTSINHFYEKLFLLKDMMNTESGKEIANKREDYMKLYIEEFMLEWNGKDLY